MKSSTIKYLTLFTSIISLILGIVIMANPFGSNIVVNYLLLIALGIAGISKICVFASTKKERSAWDLVFGILFIIVSLLLLSNETLIMEASAGYIFAGLAIVSAISRFVIAYQVRKAHPKAPIAWFIVSGIIAILFAICLICLPIFTQVVYTYIAGAFLIAYAIVAFIGALTVHTDA